MTKKEKFSENLLDEYEENNFDLENFLLNSIVDFARIKIHLDADLESYFQENKKFFDLIVDKSEKIKKSLNLGDEYFVRFVKFSNENTLKFLLTTEDEPLYLDDKRPVTLDEIINFLFPENVEKNKKFLFSISLENMKNELVHEEEFLNKIRISMIIERWIFHKIIKFLSFFNNNYEKETEKDDFFKKFDAFFLNQKNTTIH